MSRLMLQIAIVTSVLIPDALALAQPAVDEPLPQILLHLDDEHGKPIDTSGTGQVISNHGALAGAPGKLGRAYQFDGQNAYLDAGDNYGITFAFPQQTIECWVKPAEDGRPMGIVGSQEEPTRSSWRWHLGRNPDGTIAFGIWDGQQDPHFQTLTSTTVAPAGRWTHLAVTLDAGTPRTMRLYVDGRREASGPLESVTPYGSLFVGSANPGFFAGSVDEVAIYDRVLAEELLARHASGEKPIPDGVDETTAGPGFRIYPVDAAATVAIRHTAFPGKSWRLRIPEYAYRDPVTGHGVPPSAIVWERRADRTLTFHWNAPEELKKEHRLDYWGRLTPGHDVIDFELTGKNVGDKAWGEEPWTGTLSLICLGAGAHPDFHDYDAKRTFVRRDGRWITMHEIVGGQFAPHRMAGVGVRGEGKPGAERLAAKLSTDERWVTGIATDIADSLSFNFQLRASCMHSNPAWPNLKSGEEITAKGKIYLLEGGLDALWQRYHADFGE